MNGFNTMEESRLTFVRGRHEGRGFEMWKTRFLQYVKAQTSMMPWLTSPFKHNKVADETREWIDEYAMSQLALMSEDEVFIRTVKHAESLTEALTSLQEIFGLSITKRKALLLEDITRFHPRDNEMVKEYVSRMEILIRESEDIGLEILDIAVEKLKWSLPQSVRAKFDSWLEEGSYKENLMKMVEEVLERKAKEHQLQTPGLKFSLFERKSNEDQKSQNEKSNAVADEGSQGTRMQGLETETKPTEKSTIALWHDLYAVEKPEEVRRHRWNRETVKNVLTRLRREYGEVTIRTSEGRRGKPDHRRKIHNVPYQAKEIRQERDVRKPEMKPNLTETYKCRRCKTNEHIWFQCPKRKAHEKEPREHQEIRHQVDAVQHVVTEECLVDSGASTCVFGKDLEEAFVPSGKSEQVSSFTGEIVHLEMGSIMVENQNKCTDLIGLLDKSRQTSILRVESVDLLGTSGSVSVGEVILEITKKDKFKRPTTELQVVKFRHLTKTQINQLSKALKVSCVPEDVRVASAKLFKILHERLLHPCAKRTNKTIDYILGNVGYVNIEVDPCGICHMKNARKHQVAEVTEPLMHLVADLAFPDEVNVTGYEVLLVVKDRTTQYLWLFAQHKKSETAKNIMKIINTVKRRTATLTTDGGTEFKGKLSKFLEGRGITHIVTPPTSKESNGSAENAVRYVKEQMTCALELLKLPMRLWDWTVSAVSTAWNITIHKDERVPPWELLHGYPPRYDLIPGSPIVVATHVKSIRNHRGRQAVVLGWKDTSPLIDYIESERSVAVFKEEHNRNITKEEESVQQALERIEKPPILDSEFIQEIATVETAIQEPGQTGCYVEAMRKEIQSFVEHQVFRTPWPNTQTIPTQWVLTTKNDGTRKARLVVLGNLDKEKPDAPVGLPPLEQLWMLLLFAAQNNMRVAVCDISTAYLNAVIERRVNIRLPKRLPTDIQFEPNQTLGLCKAVYGLTESPALFVHHLEQVLIGLGAKKISVGVFKLVEAIIFVYVDDILIVAEEPEEAITLVKTKMKLGKVVVDQPTKYLGFDIDLGTPSLRVSLESFAAKLPDQQTRGVLTNKCVECNLESPADESLKEEALQLNGLVAWAARVNPRLAFLHAHMASRVTTHPCMKMIHSLRKIVRDIKAKPPHIIFGKEACELKLYCDGSYVGRHLTGRIGVLLCAEFASGHVTPLAWKSSVVRKKIISAFAAEAHAMVEALRLLKSHFKVLKALFPTNGVEIRVDSQALVNAIQSGNRKEAFSTDLLDFIEEELKETGVKLKWVERKWQRADELTHF